MDKRKPVVILGPTASGKTRLAVRLAEQLNGAILSADSRQVYKDLDIGTGKDLAEYGAIPYYLVDLVEAGSRFDISQYLHHAKEALNQINESGLRPMVCGGTGLYIQSLLLGIAYSEVPTNKEWRAEAEGWTLAALRERLDKSNLPSNFKADTSTAKRTIRAIEIAEWVAKNANYTPAEALLPEAVVFGINPAQEKRREQISLRLTKRLQEGLLAEVEGLLARNIHPERLIYYGLEYKYCTLYLLGEMNRETFESKLETEIHRFAKRQMTFFRSLEKRGIRIHWLEGEDLESQHAEILSSL